MEKSVTTKVDWHYNDVMQPILDHLWTKMGEANNAIASYKHDPDNPHLKDWLDRRSYVEKILGDFEND